MARMESYEVVPKPILRQPDPNLAPGNRAISTQLSI